MSQRGEMYRIHTSVGNRNEFLYTYATCQFDAAVIFLKQIGIMEDPEFKHVSSEGASVFACDIEKILIFVKEVKNP